MTECGQQARDLGGVAFGGGADEGLGHGGTLTPLVYFPRSNQYRISVLLASPLSACRVHRFASE